jgi:PAS domain S-box-containing protein
MDHTEPQWFASRVADRLRRADELHDKALHGQADPALLVEVVDDLRSALEELQVANEELRAQGDELRAARDVLEQDTHRYRDLFERVPDAYVVTDEFGVIRDANPEASILLDIPVPLLRGRPLALHVASAQRRAFRRELATMKGGRGVRRLTITLGGRQAKQDVSVRVRLVPGLADRPPELYWSFRDIGEEQREAQELRAIDESMSADDGVAAAHARELVGDLAAWWEALTGGRLLLVDRHGDLIDALHGGPGRPAAEAYRTGETVQAADDGVVAYPLQADGEIAGVLEVPIDRSGEISDRALQGVELTARAASSLLDDAHRAAAAETLAAQLQTALTSRIVIEQAKGKLAERLRCEPDDAFELLRRRARSENQRLHDVAASIVRGEIDLGTGDGR